MSTTPIYNMTDTWNDVATSFTAIKMNVTDTASADGSLLLDLAVGGSSKFTVDKDGFISDALFGVVDNSDRTKRVRFQLSGITTGTTRTITVPDASFTMVGDSTTNTLTNKTIDADNNTISNLAHGAEVDNPSSGVHGVTGSVVGTTDAQALTNKTFNLNANTLTGTLSEFNTALSNGSFASLSGSETLTNKTLTSPVLNTSVSGTAILDEDDMASDSATKLATQQSIKAYVDANSGGIGTGFINVEDYGVDLTGTTADTTPVANAYAALVAEGGGVLYFPPGTYKRDVELTVTHDNIHIVHAPGAVIDCSDLSFVSGTRNSGCAISFEGAQAASTTLASTASQGATSISVSSATGIAVGQLAYLSSTKLLQDAGGLEAKYIDINRVVGVSGTTITLEYPLHLEFSTSGETVTATFHTVLENVSVSGGDFQGGGVTGVLDNGNGRTCIHAIRCRNVSVRGAKITGYQGNGVWTEYSDIVRCQDVNFEGIPSGTSITEGQNSGFYGFYATRCRDVLASGNTGIRVRHVCDGAETLDYIQSNNKCFNSHRAAFGSHESVFGLQVLGNRSYNCYAGGVVRAFTSKWADNEFLRCTTSGMTTVVEVAADEPGRLVFQDNTVTVLDDVSASAPAVSVTGYYSPLIIKDNDLQSEGSRVLVLDARNFDDVTISGNSLKTTSTSSSICLRVERAEESMNNISISDNDLVGYTLNGVRFSGVDDITSPADRVSVVGNRGYAGSAAAGNCVFLISDSSWWGENVIVKDNWQNNDTSDCVAIDNSPAGRFKLHPIVENNVEYASPDLGFSERPRYIVGYNTSASVNGDATVYAGAVIINDKPASGEPQEWVCTAPGTEGSITGVTAVTTSGSPTVTLTGNIDTQTIAYSSLTGAFSVAETVTGGTSGCTAVITGDVGAVLTVNTVSTAFTDGETLTGGTSGATATIDSQALTSAKAYPGCFITISGAFIRQRVVSLSADFATATMSTNASGSVSGVTVNRTNPTWTAGAVLGAT